MVDCFAQARNKDLLAVRDGYVEKGLSEYEAGIATLKDYYRELLDATNEIRTQLNLKPIAEKAAPDMAAISEKYKALPEALPEATKLTIPERPITPDMAAQVGMKPIDEPILVSVHEPAKTETESPVTLTTTTHEPAKEPAETKALKPAQGEVQSSLAETYDPGKANRFTIGSKALEAPLESTNAASPAMLAQEGKPLHELVGKSDVTREGSHLTINNPETYETVRRLVEDYRAENGLGKQGHFLGLTLRGKELDHVLDVLRSTSKPDALTEAGFSPDEIKNYGSLAKAFDVAGKSALVDEGKRVATLSVSDKMVDNVVADLAKGEEKFHAKAFAQSMEDTVAEQNSGDWRKSLNDNDLFKNATNLQRDYAGRGDAVLKHEFMAKLATGNFEYLGIDPVADKDAIVKTVLDWAGDFEKTNKGINLDSFKQINETSRYFFNKYQDAVGSRGELDDGSAPAEPSSPPGREEGRADVPADNAKPSEAPDAARPPQKEVGRSKIGKTIEAKAIEKGLIQGFDSTAEFDRRNVKDQSIRIANLINSQPHVAYEMALGNSPMLDTGISPELLHQAFERIAEENGNVDQIRELANSQTVSASSFHAQELAFAKQRTPDAASTYLKEIKANREAKASAKLGKQSVAAAVSEETSKLKEAVAEARKPIIHKAVWNKFLDSIQC